MWIWKSTLGHVVGIASLRVCSPGVGIPVAIEIESRIGSERLETVAHPRLGLHVTVHVWLAPTPTRGYPTPEIVGGGTQT